jgi:Holliday junction resolvasome RuvABC endonuclease subunit
MNRKENTMAMTTVPNSGSNVNEFGAGSTLGAGEKGDGAILALDLGTKTGWALRSADGQVASGTVVFKNDRWQGGGMRFLRFKQWLTEVKQMGGGLDAVFIEEVRRHAGVDAAHVYGGFLAHVTAWCEHHGIPYEAVPVGTIKRHATGKGNASKQAVVDAMRALGHDPADDNEADAQAILHWALENRMTEDAR